MGASSRDRGIDTISTGPKEGEQGDVVPFGEAKQQLGRSLAAVPRLEVRWKGRADEHTAACRDR
jgi:hypothetical protein